MELELFDFEIEVNSASKLRHVEVVCFVGVRLETHTQTYMRASLCVLVQASARRENLSGTGQRSFERTTASTNTVGNVSKEAPGIFTWCVGVLPLRESHFGYGGVAS